MTDEKQRKVEKFIERAQNHESKDLTNVIKKANEDFTYTPKIKSLPDLKKQQEDFQVILTKSIASNKKTSD